MHKKVVLLLLIFALLVMFSLLKYAEPAYASMEFISASGSPIDEAYSPEAMVVVDLNNDAKLDLVNVATGAGRIGVLLGRGDGTFPLDSYGNYYQVGQNPLLARVADVNRDGKLDIVSISTTTVYALLGNGNGTFQAARTSVIGSMLRGRFALGDVNNDGILDVVAPINAGIAVSLGKGDGTFLPKQGYAVSFEAVATELGDFNKDGRLDVAVALNRDHKVSIMLNQGNIFTENAVIPVGQFPILLAVADFNSDSKPDIVSANQGGTGNQGTVSILLGKGDGNFIPAITYNAGLGTHSVTVSDFNGDGKLDLLTANVFSSDASVLLGYGDGTFQLAFSVPSDGRYNNVPAPHFAAPGDFNRDGRIDIGLANAVGQFSILLNQMPQLPPTITPTNTITATPTPTSTPTETTIPSATFAPTFEIPTNTPTDLPTDTWTPIPSATITPTFEIPTNTPTDLPTDTWTPVPSTTFTPTVEIPTTTPTQSPINTPTATKSPTKTSTPTATYSLTPKSTNTPTYTPSQAVSKVVIDIKPGNPQNTINRKSEGIVPVAILSTKKFDARKVDPLTIRLAGAPVQLKPKGKPMASFTDANHDGLPDLLVYVVTASLNLTKTDNTATLVGKTFEGNSIWGTDTVRIVQ